MEQARLNEAAYRLLKEDAWVRLNNAAKFSSNWSPSVEQIRNHHAALTEAIAHYDECVRLHEQAKAGA
jgi:hypothetical protein